MNVKCLRKISVSLLILVFLICETFSLSACRKSSGPTTTETLKELAGALDLRIGGYYQYDIRDTTYDAIFEQEYNVMTAGLFWQGGVDHTSRNSYDFTSADFTVDFGSSHGMEVHGHALVWFDDIPDWVNATPLSEIETVMNEHIDTVVGRYADRIDLWDVVNEAVEDDGSLRQNHTWYNAMGDDYINKAFIRAHAADPTAVLRYNDYSMESNEAKYNGVKELLRNLLNNGVPVNALGWQMHVKPGSFDPTILLTRMNEIADLGIDNYITELDVDLCSEPTTSDISDDVELSCEPTASDYEDQKQTYKSAINTFLEARRHKTIVIWGLRDGDPNWLPLAHPLPFDENYEKKPAYDGIQEALSGL